ncbi:hypothetical protein TSAR_006772, partial [Trichomalopsis sarcophagae]
YNGHIYRIVNQDNAIKQNNAIKTYTLVKIRKTCGCLTCGRLYTGKIIQLENGPTAIETKLGWTFLGRSGETVTPREDAALTVLTMFNREAQITDLWELDVLGIADPTATLFKEAHLSEVKKQFQETVRVDEEGRYEVNLPWKETHPPLGGNLWATEKRLCALTKQLDEQETFEKLDQVFDVWIDEGIIEKDPITEEDKNGFRMHEIGMAADIAKAFLQISVKPADRKVLTFLWWSKSEPREIIVYRHCRVVFGINSSPFLLAATIKHHLQKAMESTRSREERDFYAKLQASFYVDNCITSVRTIEEKADFQQRTVGVMQQAKFDLRGWEFTGSNDSGESSKILGISWDKMNDQLFLNISKPENDSMKPVTKRSILLAAHKIFDPLGWVCPVLLLPKLMLQSLWGQKIDWDAEVPQQVATEFQKWQQQVHVLEEIKVPRWIFGRDTYKVTILMFVDVSKYAYAAALFVRVEKPQSVKIDLIQAKSRIGPNNDITIPRMELLAATLGARSEWPLEETAAKEDEVNAELSKTQHKMNTTDQVTRGVNDCQTLTCTDIVQKSDDNVAWYLFNRSNYDKVLRIMAWVCRFVKLTRTPKDERKVTGELSISELQYSDETVFRLAQKDSFNGATDPRLREINVFIDDSYLLRIKFPVILDPRHELTRLLIRREHERLKHASVSITMSALRERVCILASRRTMRSIIRKYLGQLVRHCKSKKNLNTIKEGDIVLIASDYQKRLDWPLARVLQVVPGNDGVPRIAKLKTAEGELVRLLQRLIPLEHDQAETRSSGTVLPKENVEIHVREKGRRRKP